MKKVLLLLTAALLTAAASGQAATPRVYTYTASPAGFLVNSYIIEADQGVVVIDAQFLRSEARKVKALVDQTRKPLLAVIITHPHVDHYNGVAELTGGDARIPVYATAATVEGMRATEAGKRQYFKTIYGADYPDQTTFPNRVVKSGQALKLGGLTFVVRSLGAAEASDNSVVHVPELKALFAGDLLYHNTHAWLMDGHTTEWVSQLAAVKKAYPAAETVYAGHGGATTLAALDQQADYIRFVQTTVHGAAAAGTPLSAAAKARVKTQVQQRYPSYGLDLLIDMNTDVLAKETQK
ncbi:MBL fold metallo-hydrolase [Hymenobacter weizhouensis]|uniref:MBL fold metallo-hydrolase n=1 Tax=Hymenobacter sp. YIM 151500-1 TaxID=2987689 RepID=UPI002226DE7D|nr:MBL fold metallo-hydrolase [Hymenobacter sp. YIM 151500-1]UYZ64485.1 MBL fold metallo-hydrolase [Hymenobacter sp. YIM 151500-1]